MRNAARVGTSDLQAARQPTSSQGVAPAPANAGRAPGHSSTPAPRPPPGAPPSVRPRPAAPQGDARRAFATGTSPATLSKNGTSSARQRPPPNLKLKVNGGKSFSQTSLNSQENSFWSYYCGETAAKRKERSLCETALNFAHGCRQLRLGCELFDLELRVGGEAKGAHKAVLAAVSPGFRKCFAQAQEVVSKVPPLPPSVEPPREAKMQPPPPPEKPPAEPKDPPPPLPEKPPAEAKELPLPRPEKPPTEAEAKEPLLPPPEKQPAEAEEPPLPPPGEPPGEALTTNAEGSDAAQDAPPLLVPTAPEPAASPGEGSASEKVDDATAASGLLDTDQLCLSEAETMPVLLEINAAGVTTTVVNLGLYSVTLPQAVDLMLDHCYGAGKDMEYNPASPEVNRDVLRLAEEFEIPALTDRAAAWLAETSGAKNYLESLETCHDFGLDVLEEKIFCMLTEDEVAYQAITSNADLVAQHPWISARLLVRTRPRTALWCKKLLSCCL
mmetsp:Transcript_65910/g.141042  ORF Transcript_65910/g.141042 Transcript_65910/m.141042 type:complete len:499 (-) Transcript_65910:86-1582(-)